jgi:transposase
VPRQRQHPGKRGGDGTGRNPTDRGKPGVKLHVLSDAAGIPLAAKVGPANRHDSTAFEAMLDAVPGIKRPSGRRRRRPGKLHADKGLRLPALPGRLPQAARQARIARRGVERRDRLGRHRWVVERTLARLKRYRRLAVRHDRRRDIHQAFLTLACCVVCHRYLERL